MTIQEFSLKPFRSTQETVDIDISGKLSRRRGRLNLTYEVIGDLQHILVPQREKSPIRADNLWQATCFECFLAPTGQSHYWEFNLSPSYCWNVYQFQDYRQGQQPVAAIQALPFEVLCTPTALQTVWSFDLTALNLADQALSVAIATVIQFQNGQFTYWALTHPGSEPDFHRRDSFIMTI